MWSSADGDWKMKRVEDYQFIGLLFAALLLFLCNVEANLNYSSIGQLNIGGLFPLHFYDEPKRTCGSLREIGSLRRMEAMVYAINKINQNTSVLNNISLGYEIYDTCSYPAETLKQSLNFIPPYRKASSCECDNPGKNNSLSNEIIGVVGPQRSSSSVQSTILLSLYNIPQVSYLSTSDELSNDERYPYFLRTVPPDRFQVKAMIDILKIYNWRYVAFINSDDTYGKSAQQEFRQSAPLDNICLAFARTISQSADDMAFRDVIDELLDMQRESQVTSVILFMQVEMARKIFETATDVGAIRRFIWIGSDGWGNYDLQPVKGFEEAALGCFTVLPLSGTLTSFDDYFRSLSESNSHNPWLQDFSQAYGNCNGDVRTKSVSVDCQPFIDLDASDSPTHETLVIDSVNALAYALDNMHKDHCPDSPMDLCDDMQIVNGEEFKQYLLNVKVNSVANGEVSFLPNGDSQGKYSVRNLQIVDGTYQFVDVGKWVFSDTGKCLAIDENIPWYVGDFRERDTETGAPKSICSDPCDIGERRTPVPENSCCWKCTRCDVDEIVTENGTRCESCVNVAENKYDWPDESSNYTICIPIDPKDSLRENILGIVVVVFSSIGLVLTAIILSVYIKNREQPLIKASSRELCYVIYTGICLAYIVALANGLPPRSVTCVFRRIGPVLATSLIYIPLCTKTIRLYRIFQSGRKSARRPKFISPGFQMTLTFSITAIPLTWSIIWTVVTPPVVEVSMPFENRPLVELTCADSIPSSVGITLWDVTVVFVCCVYAFMTRKLPDNYNETRFITFCVFSTLVVYATFSPAYYTAAEARYKASYTALGLIIQSTVALICLFAVKIYALYFVDDEEMHIFTQSRMRANTRNSINRTMNASSDSPTHVAAPTGSFRVAPVNNPSYVADDGRLVNVKTISGGNVNSTDHQNQNNNANQRISSQHQNSTNSVMSSLTSNPNSSGNLLNGGKRNSFLNRNRVSSIGEPNEGKSEQLANQRIPGDRKKGSVKFGPPSDTHVDEKYQDQQLVLGGGLHDALSQA